MSWVRGAVAIHHRDRTRSRVRALDRAHLASRDQRLHQREAVPQEEVLIRVLDK